MLATEAASDQYDRQEERWKRKRPCPDVSAGTILLRMEEYSK
jgi:hypothetical protein